MELPLGELVVFANQAYDRFAERLAILSHLHPRSPTPLYLASGVEKLLAVEKRFGLPSSDLPARSFFFRGGFYAQVPLVAVPAQDVAGTRWLLAHEIAHLALTRVVPEPPDLVNEGLAEVLAGWMHFGPEIELREVRSVHSQFEWRLRRAVEQHNIPPLRHLFALDYWAFRAEQNEFLHYALGWHLVRFLLEDADPAVRGRFDLYLEALRAGQSGWDAFECVYDAPLVEDLWRRELARPLAWSPIFGEWWQTNGGFRSAVRGHASAALLHADRVPSEGPFELSFQVDVPVTELPADTGIGFVLAHQSPKDFHLLSLQDRGREVVLYHARSGREQRRHPRRASNDSSAARITLRIEADGSVLLQVDGDQTAGFGPVKGVHGGQVGLMLERHSLERDSASEIHFRGIRATVP
ncbi:MAG: hypothetical protein GC161_00560 [Planctomycetaceae bacterium]|nr:hypothetical protein [Planctomycetaceae bacterium]